MIVCRFDFLSYGEMELDKEGNNKKGEQSVLNRVYYELANKHSDRNPPRLVQYERSVGSTPYGLWTTWQI